jgi:hypothetical protein
MIYAAGLPRKAPNKFACNVSAFSRSGNLSEPLQQLRSYENASC